MHHISILALFSCYIGYIHCIQDMLFVFVYSCADIWNTKRGNQTFVLDLFFTTFLYIYVALSLCSPRVDYTNMSYYC